MPRVAIEDFNNEEVARIYLAARFAGAVFWVSAYKGAAFYVWASDADLCTQALRGAGLTAGLLEKTFQSR